MGDEEISVPKPNEGESILLSVKSLLGIPSEDSSFDLDCIININAALMVLTQWGVGKDGFTISGREETYSDFLGDDLDRYSGIKIYLFLKTKIVFDSQTMPGAVIEVYKEQIQELEWRMRAISEHLEEIRKKENSK